MILFYILYSSIINNVLFDIIKSAKNKELDQSKFIRKPFLEIFSIFKRKNSEAIKHHLQCYIRLVIVIDLYQMKLTAYSVTQHFAHFQGE